MKQYDLFYLSSIRSKRLSKTFLSFFFCVAFFCSQLNAQRETQGFTLGLSPMVEYSFPNSSADIHYTLLSPALKMEPSWRFAPDFSLELPLRGLWQMNLSSGMPEIQPENWFALDADLRLKYHLSNRYLISEFSRVKPYIGGGAAVSHAFVPEDFALFPATRIHAPVFGGVDWNLNRQWAIFAEAGHHFGLNGHAAFTSVSAGVKYTIRKRTAAQRPPVVYADRDGDGVPDHVDACPDIPGLPEFDGCPDTDGDGIPDHLDDCPLEPGPAYNAGCPDPYAVDSDGDGVPDIVDACPDEPGPWRFDGCPDSDGDGVPDHLDKCPDVPGLKHLDGCPDTDGDGIPDHLDMCPTQPGPPENHGCPVLDADWQKIAELAGVPVLFKTGGNTLEENYKKQLIDLATLLKKQQNFTLQIEGHTDSTGDALNNRVLSERRANAVRDFLIEQKLDPAKLYVRGMGAFHPAETNDTQQGRQKNRRVEIRVNKG